MMTFCPWHLMLSLFQYTDECIAVGYPCVRDIDTPRNKCCEGASIFLRQGCRVHPRTHAANA